MESSRRFFLFFQPIVSQESVEEGVLNLTVHMPALTKKTFPLKTQSLECANGSGVAWIHVRFEPAQLHHFKGV